MKKCLIVVDYQNDFVSGSLGFEKAKKLDSKIANLIDKYHNNSDDVVFTLDTHYDDYMNTNEGKSLQVPHCIKETIGHNLYGKVSHSVKESDLLFEKNTFGSDKLFEYLKNNRYSSIELVGVVTNICVISNAVIAKTAQPETEIIVNRNLVASNDDKLNDEALSVMSSFQIKITE